MVNTVLQRPQQKQPHTNILNTSHFIINVDIEADKAQQFIHSLNHFEAMQKANLSAVKNGVCIKLKTSNKLLSDFLLHGIHQNKNVKKTHIQTG